MDYSIVKEIILSSLDKVLSSGKADTKKAIIKALDLILDKNKDRFSDVFGKQKRPLTWRNLWTSSKYGAPAYFLERLTALKKQRKITNHITAVDSLWNVLLEEDNGKILRKWVKRVREEYLQAPQKAPSFKPIISKKAKTDSSKSKIVDSDSENEEPKIHRKKRDDSDDESKSKSRKVTDDSDDDKPKVRRTKPSKLDDSDDDKSRVRRTKPSKLDDSDDDKPKVRRTKPSKLDDSDDDKPRVRRTKPSKEDDSDDDTLRIGGKKTARPSDSDSDDESIRKRRPKSRYNDSDYDSDAPNRKVRSKTHPTSDDDESPRILHPNKEVPQPADKVCETQPEKVSESLPVS